MTPDVIQATRAFLERVQLQGREVAAYNRVMMELAHEEQIYTEAAQAKAKAATVDKVDGPQ